MMTDANIWETFWLNEEAEAHHDFVENCPVRSQVRKVSFVSRSKGRGRKRRRSKEVTFVVYGKNAYVWRDTPNNTLDRIAAEVMGGQILPGENAWSSFAQIFESMEPA